MSEEVTTKTAFEKKIDGMNDEEIYTFTLEFYAKRSSMNQGVVLRQLYSILESKHGKNPQLRKTLIALICLYFEDVLPTYGVITLSDSQKEQNMKNETIKCYKEQEAMLNYYKKFLLLLQSVLTKSFDSKKLNHIYWTEEDEFCMLKSAIQLYKRNPNFNFSKILLDLIIPYVNVKINDKKSKFILKAIEEIINDDKDSSVTLKICQAIKKYIKKAKFNFSYVMLKPLLNIDIEDISVEETGPKKKDRKEMSRKERKNNKKNKGIEELKEKISAKQSVDVKLNNNTLVLRNILEVYFCLLKNKNIQSKQLGLVLDGFTKFGRLIETKYLPEIFDILKDLTHNSKISISNRIKCVTTIITILTSGKTATILDIDPGNYVSSLISIVQHTNIEEEGIFSLIICCNKMLTKLKNRIAESDVKALIIVLISRAMKLNEIPYLCVFILINILRYLQIHLNSQFFFEEEDKEDFQENDEEFLPEPLKELQILTKSSSMHISKLSKAILRFFKLDPAAMSDGIIRIDANFHDLSKLPTQQLLETLKQNIHTKRSAPSQSGNNNSRVSKKKRKC